jgi:hypothetical protein
MVSNFLITMNTNVRFEQDDALLEKHSEPLYGMAEALFGDGTAISRFVEFGSRGARGPGGKFTFVPTHGTIWSTESIVDYRVTVGVEVGHNVRGKRLHLHVALKIRHHSYIRLDRDKILAQANAALKARDFPFPIKHLNIRVTPPTAEDYLMK